MTTEEIKKIAEEYAKIVMNPHKSDPDMTGVEWQAEFDACAEAAEDILGTISTCYYLVEKGKVEEEYQDSKKSYERNKGDEGYFEGYWEGRVDSYEDILGPDIRKEEEDA